MARLDQLQAFLKDSPDDSFILFAIAKEYEKLQDKENALKYYQDLVAKDADYVGTYYHLGQLLEELEQKDEALDIYTKGIAIAQKLNDQHAKSELMGVKMNLEMDL